MEGGIQSTRHGTGGSVGTEPEATGAWIRSTEGYKHREGGGERGVVVVLRRTLLSSLGRAA